jgi:hypothetical protein
MYSESDLRDALQWKAQTAAPLIPTSPTGAHDQAVSKGHRSMAMVASIAAVLALAGGVGLLSHRNGRSAPAAGTSSGSVSASATPPSTASTMASLTAPYGTLTNVAGHTEGSHRSGESRHSGLTAHGRMSHHSEALPWTPSARTRRHRQDLFRPLVTLAKALRLLDRGERQ